MLRWLIFSSLKSSISFQYVESLMTLIMTLILGYFLHLLIKQLLFYLLSFRSVTLTGKFLTQSQNFASNFASNCFFWKPFQIVFKFVALSAIFFVLLGLYYPHIAPKISFFLLFNPFGRNMLSPKTPYPLISPLCRVKTSPCYLFSSFAYATSYLFYP